MNEVILEGTRGELLEGLSSNFFVLQGGAVVTAEEGVLAGTVRELVLEVREGGSVTRHGEGGVVRGSDGEWGSR